MQILLLRKVGKLKSGLNTVKDSYGRFLIQQKSALSCTLENLENFKKKIHLYTKEQEKTDKEILELCKALDNKFIFISSKVNDTGNLYGSIKPYMIVEHIKGQLNASDLLKNQHISMKKITKPGIFSITVLFDKSHNTNVNVVVANNEKEGKDMYFQHINNENK